MNIASSRDGERERGYVGRVEHGDDDDCADVIDDGESHEKELQRGGDVAAKKRDHAECECDVGGGGDGPAAHGECVALVQCAVDQRRHHHSAECGEGGQGDLARAGEFPAQHFALEFQSDGEEKDRHEAIVDPQQQRLLHVQFVHPYLHLHAEESTVGVLQGGVGEDQRQRTGQHHQDASTRLGGYQLAQCIHPGSTAVEPAQCRGRR
jgi:hypothetical protein